ncbi:hypothetical protein ACFFKE_12890 [Streptomyces mutabilis]|jgi:hypothetical protein|uniref:hypothetical protein n=1 Tax=Streptomyces mutabilis TaxID=67332 RepID=UPI00177F9283|nr:hypothetical protein [Streptomyces mutabilis]GGQ29616.1 hypothetical protein GCM10010279_42090 [Streptomyces mutabilis]
MGYYTWQAQESHCVICSRSLTGRQERYCSNACRQAHKRQAALTNDAALGKRTCDFCERSFWPESKRQRFCSPVCADGKRSQAEDARWDAVCQLDGCEDNAGWDGTGRARRYCSRAHQQKAYRLRKKAEGTA